MEFAAGVIALYVLIRYLIPWAIFVVLGIWGFIIWGLKQ